MKNIIIIYLLFISFGAKSQEKKEFWDVMSDTWVATDGLGRQLPDASEVGAPKKDKTIGIFYFIWQGRHGELGPFDISKILAADPDALQKADSPLWGPLGAPHYWGEPLFGYYIADDDFVIRKHAQMLSDAGVDVIIFDVTNRKTYPESYGAVCRVYHEMRQQGNRTPQIAFMTSFSRADNTETTLWKDFYSKGAYSDLWFRWKGKPLMMANPDFIMAEKQDYVFPDKQLISEQVKPDAPIGQSFAVDRPLKKVAIRVPTWRTSDAAVRITLYQMEQEKAGGKQLLTKIFTNIKDNDWLSLTPDEPLSAGKYYLELSYVSGTAGWWSVAENNIILDGQAFLANKPCEGTRMIRMTRIPEDDVVDPLLEFFTFRSPFPNFFEAPKKPDQWAWLQVYPQHGFYSQGNEPDADGKLSPEEEHDYSGQNFAQQWSRAFELDPEFVFITGWNEWIASRFPRETRWNGSETQAVNFVDQFNREHSRDIEPMKGGHGDAFYYQMIAYNRKFKGVREVEPVHSQPITIDGKFDDWKEVSPEFRDAIGDPVRRDYRGWSKDSHYENHTGRNDLIAAKVSYDKKTQTLFFYAQTQAPIIGEGEPNWMLLYLNMDADAKTGWLGYDYLIEGKMLRKNIENKYRWQKTGAIKGTVAGNEYEIAIPLKSLGLTSLPKSFFFKWADNIQQTGDWSDFSINGDVAPNDRYSYKAVIIN
ncbi:hypothetical protein AGMMS50239_21030 [Bacteroidia bacterium]|nr:hypothetical protein AGMMS50239_21030 [Bacteroidia bacterium]